MYIKILNGKVDTYPYSIAQLRKDNPNTSFPKNPSDEMLAAWGVYSCSIANPPEYDTLTQEVSQNIPEQDESGNWIVSWTVNNLPIETATNNIRNLRNFLLSETDWIITMSAEKDEAVPVEVAAYRQALRDLPAQEGFPFNVTWPSKPS